MEIEKKFLIKALPPDIVSYPHVEIQQAYINAHNPTLRVRKRGDEYIFTYKNRVEDKPSDMCVCDEVECPLDKDTYEKLLGKAEGIIISKDRYMIPYEGHTIELDVFHGDYEGVVLAEVEFDSIDECKEFSKPDWFGDDVSDDVRYSNSYMAFN